ncbi:MAG: hypothetical protein IJJ22_03035 [Oscillospiraceae bacterium]|nr:hypothetical protein [Oscillospiraceae bacterium]
MQKTTDKIKFSRTVNLLNIVAVIVAVAAFIVMVKMINELNGSFNRDPYNSMEYSLQSGDYADMVRTYYYKSYDVAPFETAYEEEYHVAEYADAAFRHRFFEATGNEVMAKRFAERMQKARDGCGSLQVSANDIDRIISAIELYP